MTDCLILLYTLSPLPQSLRHLCVLHSLLAQLVTVLSYVLVMTVAHVVKNAALMVAAMCARLE